MSIKHDIKSISMKMVSYGVFGRNEIEGLLRVWIAPVIRCLLILLELFLIGLGRGDSRLVIPSLLFFVPRSEERRVGKECW